MPEGLHVHDALISPPGVPLKLKSSHLTLGGGAP